eukprot:14341051-Ditylum_brightwellii.AAC.1
MTVVTTLEGGLYRHLSLVYDANTCSKIPGSAIYWNSKPKINRTYDNFKKDFHKAQHELQCTGDIIVEEGLNHTELIKMVTEGVQQALAYSTLYNLLEEQKEQAVNLTNDNSTLQHKLAELQAQLAELQNAPLQQMQNSM